MSTPATFVDPGAAGSDPGATPSGGSPDSGVDLDTSLAEAESAVLADFTGQPRPVVGGKEGGGDPPMPAALREHIDKNYQGDVGAFLHAQYESRAESARLAAEVKELRESVKKTPAAPPRDQAVEFKAAREQSPEILAIDQQIQSIDNGIKATNQRQFQIAEQAAPIKADIAKIEVELGHAEGDEYNKLFSRLVLLRQDWQALNSEYLLNQSNTRNNTVLRGQLERELRLHEEHLREGLQREESDEVRNAQSAEADLRVYNTAFAHHIGGYGVDPKSPMFARLQRSVRLQLADELLGLPPGTPELDPMQLADMVGQLVEQNLTDLGISKSVRRGSISSGSPSPRPVLTRSGVVPGAGADAGPASRTRQDLSNAMKDADFVRKRAAALSLTLVKRGSGRL